ncbi:MAG: Transcriptional repressor NrdR [Candidatus Saccharibacteria bacterium]|nr:Transcriptional repressor NrdR [Candidatus Saccharibacteria bacterium]
MVCPFCEHCDTKVVDKRESDAVSTRRRRECLGCHQRFTTYERVEQPDLVVTKHDGRTESFNPEKLRKGIALAIAKRPVTGDQVDRTVEEIEAELRSAKRREVPAGLIGALVMEKLKALDHVAYIRFASVYRDFTSASSFQDEVKELLRSHREARGDKVEHS